MATTRLNATPSLAIIDALDSLTSQVRKAHPDVPTNIVIALASGRTKKQAVHGHFAPGSWAEGAHEILIGAESLKRGANAVLGTLIHELAHAKAHALEIRDTSNNGRYHNKKFKAIAEEMGIELAEIPTHGWTQTTLPEATADRYRQGLDKLAKALTTYRVDRSEEAAPKPRKASKGKIACACEDEVTVSLQWFERNEEALYCTACDTAYELVA